MVGSRGVAGTLLVWLCMLFGYAGSAFAGPLDHLIMGGAKLPGSGGIPPVERAFELKVSKESDNNLIADWDILSGVYLYRDRITFSSPNSQVVLGKPILPKGKSKVEIGLNGKPETLIVYYKAAQVIVPIIAAPKGLLTIDVRYQGCEETNGICYQPVNKSFEFTVASAIGEVAATAKPVAGSITPVASEPNESGADLGLEPTAEQSFLKVLQDENIILALLLAFLFGAGLALTPCSYPVIPLVSAVIVGSAQHVSRSRTIALSFAYVLGIVVVYSAVGALFAWLGSNLFGDAQSVWVLGPIGVLIILFALSMYGLFNLQLPSGLQSKLNNVSANQQGGSIVNVFLIGLLSALIMGACTTPFIAATLTFIGQSGDVIFGMAIMAMLGAGQGAPLILIAAIAGIALPKAGSWMDTIKTLLATMLLAAAILIAGRLFSPTTELLLWGVWFTILGVQLGAFVKIEKPGPIIAAKGLGIAAIAWGVITMIGAAMGGTRFDAPLSGLVTVGAQQHAGSESQPHMTYVDIPDLDVLQATLNAAKAEKKPVFLSITAPAWCASCQVNEREVLSKPNIIAAFDSFARLEINLDEESSEEAQMLKVLNLQMQGKHAAIVGPPVMLFYDRMGKLQLSLSGKVTSAKLLAVTSKLSK